MRLLILNDRRKKKALFIWDEKKVDKTLDKKNGYKTFMHGENLKYFFIYLIFFIISLFHSPNQIEFYVSGRSK